MPGDSPLKILVVERSRVMRDLIAEAVNQNDRLTLVGLVDDLDSLPHSASQARPDVVVVDAEETSERFEKVREAIRLLVPQAYLVAFSASYRAPGEPGQSAVSVFRPPTSSLKSAREYLSSELVPVLMSLAPADPSAPARHSRRSSRSTSVDALSAPVDLVVIGTSTGGPTALTRVLGSLPASFPVPILVVQHMPAKFTPLLAERLDHASRLSVVEAAAGMRLEPGVAYVAPGDRHLALESRTKLAVLDTEPVNSCRPAADVLFASVAAQRMRALAVLLTGMGSDGTSGARDIVAAGGLVLCQDEGSSVVWGMPGAAVKAGLPYRVLPLSLIASEIHARVRGGGA